MEVDLNLQEPCPADHQSTHVYKDLKKSVEYEGNKEL